MKNYFFSVIIPVYNDENCLKILLKHLNKQTYPLESFEIIIVDNGGTLDKNNYTEHKNLILCSETTKGPYAARNKGISLSKGEILAFTDADCMPCADWLYNANKYFSENPESHSMGGQIEISFKNKSRPTVIELYDYFMGLNLQNNWIENEKYAATANFFIKRIVFDKTGTFDPSLLSGGDAEMGNRLYKKGYETKFCKDATIIHPAISSLKTLILKRLRDTIGTLNTIEKYNYSKRSPVNYIHLQLIQRPAAFFQRINASPFNIPFFKKICLISLFFIIKTFQVFERGRVILFGNPLR